MFRKIIKYINENNDLRLILLSLSSILAFFVFDNFIKKIINKIISSIWELSNFGLAFEVFLLLIYILIIIYLISKIFSNFIENKPKLFFFITISIIYSYFRLFDTSYVFLKFSFLNFLAYLDFLFILGLSSIILLIINYYQTYKKSNAKLVQDITNDTPWTNGDKDELNRYEAAIKISKEIIKSSSLSSISYAILGRWGEGKTSFLNMIKTELGKNENTIIIDFNPWKSVDKKLIQKDFFKNIKEGLSSYSSEIYPSLNKYIEILFETEKSKIAKLFYYFIQEQNQILNRYENVNKAFRKIDKKIIVFIDDIDRLSSTEIFEVLKLIRNNANFDNTVFIAAFDKNYINNAIKQHTAYENDYFIEKIFQQEIILPSYPYSVLTNKLIKKLKLYYTNETSIYSEINAKLQFKPDNYSPILGWSGNITGYISEYIENLRDVNRFFNSFIHSYDIIKNEIDIIDFFHLELLKLKALPIYEAIRNRSILKGNINNYNTYSLDEDKFNELAAKLELTKKESVENVLKKLFPDNNNGYDPRSISFQKNFLIYFSNQLFDRLSRTEFQKIFVKYDESIIKDWLDKGFLPDIIEYLSSISYSAFKNKIEFEQYISFWFYLIESGYDINTDYLVSIFSNDDIKKEIIKNLFDNKDVEFNNVFINKITNAKFPFRTRTIIYKLISNYQYHSDYKFTLSEKELKNQALTYLESYLDKSQELDNDGMWLYYTCVDNIDKDHKVHLLEKASKLMKEFIIKHPNYYLDTYIRPLYTPDDGHMRTGEPFAKSIFGSYEEFEKFIENNKTHPKYKVIREFFDRYKSNNYQPVYYENYPTN